MASASVNGNGHTHNGYADPALRLPPHNIEAERGILGSILIDAEVIDTVLAKLTVGRFYRDIHQIIFRVMRDLRESGKPVDLISVADMLDRCGKLKDIGGYEFLTDLVAEVPHGRNAEYWADIVLEKSIGRDLIEQSEEIRDGAYSQQKAVGELVSRGQRSAGLVGRPRRGTGIRSASPLARRSRAGRLPGPGRRHCADDRAAH